MQFNFVSEVMFDSYGPHQSGLSMAGHSGQP